MASNRIYRASVIFLASTLMIYLALHFGAKPVQAVWGIEDLYLAFVGFINFIGCVLDIFYNLLQIGFAIIKDIFLFIFNFLTAVVSASTGNSDIVSFDPELIYNLKQIPYFSLILLVIGFLIEFAFIISAFMVIKHY